MFKNADLKCVHSCIYGTEGPCRKGGIDEKYTANYAADKRKSDKHEKQTIHVCVPGKTLAEAVQWCCEVLLQVTEIKQASYLVVNSTLLAMTYDRRKLKGNTSGQEPLLSSHYYAFTGPKVVTMTATCC